MWASNEIVAENQMSLVTSNQNPGTFIKRWHWIIRAIMIQCICQGLQRQNHWPTTKVLCIEKWDCACDIWALDLPSKGINTSAADNAVTAGKFHDCSTVKFENGSWRLVDLVLNEWAEVPDERAHCMWLQYPPFCARLNELHKGYCTGWTGTGCSFNGWHHWQGCSSWPPRTRNGHQSLDNNCPLARLHTHSLTTMSRLRWSNIAWLTWANCQRMAVDALWRTQLRPEEGITSAFLHDFDEQLFTKHTSKYLQEGNIRVQRLDSVHQEKAFCYIEGGLHM